VADSFRTIHHDQIDGVDAYWLDVPGPFSAALTFRVGRADEPPARYGITHLVEHLALAPLGVQEYEHNGGVETLRTIFQVTGSRADVTTFLADATHALSALPTSRLLIERSILKREAEENSRGLGDALRGYRFGGIGAGATAEEEFGILWLGEDLVRAWADERFGRSNAVLVLSGPPDGIRLNLHDGKRFPAPELTAAAETTLPAYVKWNAPGVALTYVTPRQPGANMVANILHRRMRSRLRFDIGAVYDVDFDYDRISGDMAHVALTTEADERQTKRVQSLMLEIVDQFATDGPTPEELAYEVTAVRRSWEHDDAQLGFVFETAFDALLGDALRDPEEFIRQREAVTPDVARELMRPALDSLIAFGEADNPAPDRLTQVPEWSTDTVTGDTYAPAGFHLPGRGPKARLIIGDEGVTLRLSPTERVTVRYADMIAAVHAGDTRRLHGPDAVQIMVDAAEWRDGARIIERIDAGTPPHAFVCTGHAEGGLEDPEGRT
jgi:hypothetical protein